MIERVTGNLLEADVEALVNTVNTVGVMGKGLALQFRQAFPENYQAYQKACAQHEVRPGQMFVFTTGQLTNPRYIINFPTKRHWRQKTRIQDIDDGLGALIEVVRAKGIRSLAVPPLGCGSGGLAWDEVRPRIEKVLNTLPDVQVLLYEPAGAPEADHMRIATKPPRMTPGRAALIGVLNTYALPGYRITMLEIQKLAYFLQRAGEPLSLDYTKGAYGPYTEVLHHVLQRIEGHFIRGYGDRSRDVSIRVFPEAVTNAQTFLQHHPETQKRLERVARLIEGFETPYGLELLATVHWLTQENPAVADDVDLAIRGVLAWNAHKRRTFHPEHIRIAWKQLSTEGWFSSAELMGRDRSTNNGHLGT